MRRKADVAVAGAAIALLLLILVATRQTDGGPASVYSTYDFGPNGYAAVAEMLRREHVPAGAFEYPLSMLGARIKTLVITGPVRGEPQSAFTRGDADALIAWLKRGGRVMLLGKPAAADDAHLRALAKKLGPLRVSFIRDAAAFSNARLARDGNARRAYALLRFGPVAFDENVHGFSAGRGFWAALPAPVRIAAIIAGALVLIFLIGANIRFAPAQPARRIADRDSSAYIESVARLLQRGRAIHRAIADHAAGAQRLMRLRGAAGKDRDALFELERLAAVEHPGDEDLLYAGYLSRRLRSAR